MLDSEMYQTFKECQKVRPIDISSELPRHPTKKHKLRNFSKIKRIVVHTTDWEVIPRLLAEYDIGPNHISPDGCPAITYHDLITSDGMLYHTLPFEEISWHVGIWNPSSIGVALVYRVGNSLGRDTYGPSSKAMKTLQCRCGDLCMYFGLPPNAVVGHRELKGTGWFMWKGSRRLRKTCPGLKVDLDQLRKNIATYMQITMHIKGYYDAEIDGIWGPVSRAAYSVYLASQDRIREFTT